MKSNYKRLGDYIREVNNRNTNLEDVKLLGVSIQKVFIPSIANTIGTNMSTYKLIKKGQFAYGPVTSRNGDKISVALLNDYEKAIISQAYTSFEVIDENQLLPEYLMMWFRRPEFDRYARFKSHGSAREIFGWEEMCNTTLPVPSITMQTEIVKEYNVILERINLNTHLIQKLEETAQAIYKQWFVDFEFPNENGEPYKSSGGEMEFNRELDKDIPKGWRVGSIGEILAAKGYIRGPFGSALKKDEMVEQGIPVYEQQHAIDNHRRFRYFITEEKYSKLERFAVKENDFVISCSGTLGKITVINENDPKGIINQALLILRADTNKLNPICLKYFLTSKEGNNLLVAEAGGSAQVNIAKREEIESIPLVIPDSVQQSNVSKLLTRCDNGIYIKKKENDLLERTIKMFLTKLAVKG
jgi:type I restriction enzyme, S subunit